MAKELTEQQKLLLRRAKQAANAAGKDWSKLSQEERRQYKRDAREAGRKTSAQASPAREKAIKAAEAVGKKWSELSADERAVYLRQARQRS